MSKSASPLLEALAIKDFKPAAELIKKYLNRKTKTKWHFLLPDVVSLDGKKYTSMAFAADDGKSLTILFSLNAKPSSSGKVEIVNYYKAGLNPFDDAPTITVKYDISQDTSLAKILPSLPSIIAGKVKAGDLSVPLVESSLDFNTDESLLESLTCSDAPSYIPTQLFDSVVLLLANSQEPLTESAIVSQFGDLGLLIAKAVTKDTLDSEVLFESFNSNVDLYASATELLVKTVHYAEPLFEAKGVSKKDVVAIFNYMLEKTNAGGFTLTNIHHDLSLAQYKVASQFMKDNKSLFVKNGGKSYIKNPNGFMDSIGMSSSDQAAAMEDQDEEDQLKNSAQRLMASVTKSKTPKSEAKITMIPAGLNLDSDEEDIERVSFEETLEDLDRTLRLFLKSKAMHLFTLGGIGGIGKCLPKQTEVEYVLAIS